VADGLPSGPATPSPDAVNERSGLARRVDETTVIAGAGQLRRHAGWTVRFAIVWMTLLVVLVLTADLLPLRSVEGPVDAPLQRPGVRWEFLGTDGFGRSEISRLIYGARVSVAVGFFSTAFGLVVGGLIGSTAGYLRGRVDAVINFVIDAWVAFPTLVFLLALAAVLEPSVPMLIVTIGLLVTPHFARLARANSLRFANREFVTAARLMGASHRRILFREIIANVVFPVATYAFLLTAAVIVAESSLSFLGFGVKPPQPTWGNMIEGGRRYLSTAPHVVFVPALTMLLTVFSLNVIGDHALARLDRRGPTS
jgi:peptide/nickel transport system permease protein